MTLVSSPLFWMVLGVVGAARSATAAATRLTHPRLSTWLAAFAAALPADVTRMSPGATPPKKDEALAERESDYVQSADRSSPIASKGAARTTSPPP